MKKTSPIKSKFYTSVAADSRLNEIFLQFPIYDMLFSFQTIINSITHFITSMLLKLTIIVGMEALQRVH